MIYMTILCGCWLLYGSGLWARFMNKFKLEPTPATPPPKTRATPPQENDKTITDREKLEIQARPVVAAMGSNPDTVKYMSDKLLAALVKDYTNEILKN